MAKNCKGVHKPPGKGAKPLGGGYGGKKPAKKMPPMPGGGMAGGMGGAGGFS